MSAIAEVRNAAVMAVQRKHTPEAQRALSRFVALLDELTYLESRRELIARTPVSSAISDTDFSGDKPSSAVHGTSQQGSNSGSESSDQRRTYDTRIQAIQTALSAETPNIELANRTISNIENELMRECGGRYSRFVYRMTDGAPIVAVYWALLGSLLLSGIFVGSYYIFPLATHWQLVANFIPDEEPRGLFYTTAIFAFLGAVVSIAFRVQLADIEHVGLMPLFLTNLFKPYIGAIFGIVIFCLLESGIVIIPGINEVPGQMTVALSTYVSAVVGFLSGFSERFATDLIERSSTLFQQRHARERANA